MTLVISNDDVARALSMPAVIATLESAYRELGEGRALSRRRSDTITHTSGGDAYSLKSMDGVVPSLGVGAVRINSDVLTWPTRDGNVRREKLPAAHVGRWVGLVILFSTENGEPLAMFPDGVVQRMRVGATSGLGVKYMAREDAREVAIIGSGWQAGSQVMAACAVRAVDRIRVFSPNQAHRQAFADEWSEQLGVPIEAVDSAERAVAGADVVLCATNTLQPIMRPEWVQPGMHFGAVKRPEVDMGFVRRCDRIAIHSGHVKPAVLTATGLSIPGAERGQSGDDEPIPWEDYPELPELILGRVPGRQSNDEVTCFVNNIGLGFQFAAVGGALYRQARELGLGRDLPTDWFVQEVHP